MNLTRTFFRLSVIGALLFAAVFVCQGTIHSLLNKHAAETYSVTAGGTNQLTEPDCCNSFQEPLGTDHTISAILTVPLALTVLISFVSLLSVAGHFIYRAAWYARAMRQYLGSFVSLNPFFEYFRLGLLHPKLF